MTIKRQTLLRVAPILDPCVDTGATLNLNITTSCTSPPVACPSPSPRALDRTAKVSERLVVCGDTNVTADDRDVWSPSAWAGKIHCSPKEREALAEVIVYGLVDLIRQHNPDRGPMRRRNDPSSFGN